MPVKNESLAFAFDLSAPVKVVKTFGPHFDVVYNRVSCPGRGTPTQDADFVGAFFGSLSTVVPLNVVDLESVSVEMPDDDYGLRVPREICFAYRTADGSWYGRLDRVLMAHDAVARVSHVTLDVHAVNVDVFALIIFEGSVSKLSYVAKPRTSP